MPLEVCLQYPIIIERLCFYGLVCSFYCANKSIQRQIAVHFEHNLLDTQFTNTLLPLKFTTSDQPNTNLPFSPQQKTILFNLMFRLMLKNKIVFYYENSRSYAIHDKRSIFSSFKWYNTHILFSIDS